MPTIVPIQPPTATGHIAGIQYKSGRRIYCGHDPAAGIFVSHPEHAARWPSQAEAESALESLLKAFEVIHTPSLHLFIEPAPSSH